MKLRRYDRSRRSRFNRENQFWREARERHQHTEGTYSVRKKPKAEYCAFCHKAPCDCDQLYEKFYPKFEKSLTRNGIRGGAADIENGCINPARHDT